MHSIKYKLNEGIIRTAVFKYLFAKFAYSTLFVGFPIMIISTLAGIIYEEDLYFFLAMSFGIFILLLFIIRYVVASRRSILLLCQLSDGNVEITFDDDNMKYITSSSVSDVKYNLLHNIMKFNNVWLITVKHSNGFIIVPTKNLTDNDKNAIINFVNKSLYNDMKKIS